MTMEYLISLCCSIVGSITVLLMVMMFREWKLVGIMRKFKAFKKEMEREHEADIANLYALMFSNSVLPSFYMLLDERALFAKLLDHSVLLQQVSLVLQATPRMSNEAVLRVWNQWCGFVVEAEQTVGFVDVAHQVYSSSAEIRYMCDVLIGGLAANVLFLLKQVGREQEASQFWQRFVRLIDAIRTHRRL